MHIEDDLQEFCPKWRGSCRLKTELCKPGGGRNSDCRNRIQCKMSSTWGVRRRI